MSNIIFNLSDVFCNKKIDITQSVGIERLLGTLILNRIVGIAIDNINFSTINKEFRKTLQFIKKHQDYQCEVFYDHMIYICDILKNANFEYALLKGAVLNLFHYKKGQRTSNDIDILVRPSNVNELQNVLLNNGFIQGYCDENNTIIKPSRRDIIDSKLNNGETIPFLKEINGNFIEVDINFSTDYKYDEKSGFIVNDMLNNTERIITDKLDFYSLNNIYFLLHLCLHLYKEATTYDWVINRRDLMLYKFSDINVMLHNYYCDDYFKKIIKAVKKLSIEKECYYALKLTSVIYPNVLNYPGFTILLDSIKPDDLKYMKEIILPREKRVMRYNIDFEDWFNADNRVSYLV